MTIVVPYLGKSQNTTETTRTWNWLDHHFRPFRAAPPAYLYTPRSHREQTHGPRSPFLPRPGDFRQAPVDNSLSGKETLNHGSGKNN